MQLSGISVLFRGVLGILLEFVGVVVSCGFKGELPSTACKTSLAGEKKNQ